MKRILKILVWIVVIIVLFFGGFLIFITIFDYRPEKVEILLKNNKAGIGALEKDTFKLMTWNIGYAGLGKEMDFFYDGGKKVRPTRMQARKYLNGIKDFVNNHKNVDFFLLQEIDVKSKRSYRMNEVDELGKILPDYTPVFAINYQVPFVPVPLYEPMGSVKGGLITFSKYYPQKAIRYAYPVVASWPDRLFLLNRCFIMVRFPLTEGKDLVVINTHNSAYVYDSISRNQELQVIKNKMLEEYHQGNYVIAGGDWNANPPFYKPANGYDGHRFVRSEVKMNPALFPEGWHWAFDPTAPTNRQNNQPFVKGENGTTCLDYFVASPNIEVITTQTIDLAFENSDHNPVVAKIYIKQ